MILRPSLIVTLLALAAASEAEECPLNGTWKSDAARTLAAIADKSPPAALNVLSKDFFGHMVHEWTCTGMRAWFDYYERPEPTPYTVVESDVNSVVVSFPDSSDGDLRLIFEGECYKVQLGEERFEYFCPVGSGDGA